jgi:phage tail-like protein
VDGQIQRKNGSVVVLDDTLAEQVRWNFSGAWISKWEGPAFTAKGNDVAIETLTISCESLKRA